MGNVTGFQRPYTFRQNATYKTVGLDQAVTYKVGAVREVEVPENDNLKPAGVVTYQQEVTDGATVAVQLDRIAEVEAEGAVQAGQDLIVAAGGKVKAVSALSAGTLANVIGEAQNNAVDGQMVQVLIRPKSYKV